MPQLGETVTEGTVAVWHKQVGDTIAIDEILLDVETDKVATEIPAPVTGVLTEIRVNEGETVPVGAVLAVVQTGKEKEKQSTIPETNITIQSTTGNHSTGDAGVRAELMHSRDEQLSPAVRRLLVEHALTPANIQGTGHDGRITRKDVLEYLASTEKHEQGSAGARDIVIPFNRLRRVTAEHMVRSKAVSPHVLQAIEVDFHAVTQCRAMVADEWKGRHGYSLTYLPFIAHAVCAAIHQYPRINASVENDCLVIHPAVNLAIAVDLNFEGLVAPVIRSAHQLTVTQLAQRIHDLVVKSRESNLRPDDLSSGTYTISNSGSFGTLFTAPIINQPQVAILSVDSIHKRPIVISSDSGDEIAVRPMGILAQSFDHRAVDGAYSAAFLHRLKKIIEETDWEQEVNRG